MAKIKITYDGTGGFTYDVSGVQGRDCLGLTKFIEGDAAMPLRELKPEADRVNLAPEGARNQAFKNTSGGSSNGGSGYGGKGYL